MSTLMIETGRAAAKTHDRADEASRAAHAATSAAHETATKVDSFSVSMGRKIDVAARHLTHMSDVTSKANQSSRQTRERVSSIEEHTQKIALVATRTGEAISHLVESESETQTVLDSVATAIGELGSTVTDHAGQLRSMAETVRVSSRETARITDTTAALKALTVEVNQVNSVFRALSATVAEESQRAERARQSTDQRVMILEESVANVAAHVQLLREALPGSMMGVSAGPAVEER